MDDSINRMTRYICGLRYEDLTPHIVHDCKRRIADTLGCGLGAWHAEPSRIARTIAMRSQGATGARLLGMQIRVLPELAAFANGVMMRYLDGNDSYPGGGGHASDTISGILALADERHVDGRTVITAVVGAYDVFYNLYTAARLRERGWDHVFYIAVASAAGAAKILGLDEEKTSHALALAITPNLALEVTRRGHLSAWKGCAGGNAARNGVFAALLAAEGLTGPDKPIEGVHGLWHVSGKFELAPFPRPGGVYRIAYANLKLHLSEYHSQSPIAAAMALHGQVAVEDIDSITLYTYAFAHQEIGNEPEKWHPQSRETADHSLPYIITAVLIDGVFSDAIFSRERLADPRIHALIDRVKVKEDPQLTQNFPEKVPCRLEVVTRQGTRKTASVDYPRGHHRNPMSDDEVAKKFLGLAERVLPATQAQSLLESLWHLETCCDLESVFSVSVRPTPS